MTIALGIIFVIVAIAVVALVLMQDSDAVGLGAMAGSMSNFGGKSKAKNGMLSKLTVVCAIVLVVIAIVLTVIA